MARLAASLLICGALAWQAPAWGDPADPALPPAPSASPDSTPVPVGLALAPLRAPRTFGAFLPEALATDAFGRVFALDRGAGRILRFAPEGGVFAFGPSDQGSSATPILTGIFAGRGPDLYAIDAAAGLLYRFDLDGRLRATLSYAEGLRDAGLATGRAAEFTLGNAGEMYLLDRLGGRLLLFDRSGRFVTDLFAGLAGSERPRSPIRLALTDDGTILVLDASDDRIHRFSREGAALPAWRGSDSTSAGAESPGLLAITGRGRIVLVSPRQGRLWIRDREGRLLATDRIMPAPPDVLADAKAMGDSLLLLACPGKGEILRWRLAAPDHGTIPAPR